MFSFLGKEALNINPRDVAKPPWGRIWGECGTGVVHRNSETIQIEA